MSYVIIIFISDRKFATFLILKLLYFEYFVWNLIYLYCTIFRKWNTLLSSNSSKIQLVLVFNRPLINFCSIKTKATFLVWIQNYRSHRKQHFVIIAGRLTRRSQDLDMESRRQRLGVERKAERNERKRTNKQEFNLITRNTSGLENKVLSLVPPLPVAGVVHLFSRNVVFPLAGPRNFSVLPSRLPFSRFYLLLSREDRYVFEEVSSTIKWTNHSWRWARYLATFTVSLTARLEDNTD